MIAEALRKFLAATPAVAGSLATYVFDDEVGAEPAIFTTSIPEDAGCPCAYIHIVGGTEFGARAFRGSVVHADVSIFDDQLQNSVRLDALARAVWRALDRGDLTPYLAEDALDDWGCQAQSPFSVEAPGSFPQRVVSVTARVGEQETLQ